MIWTDGHTPAKPRQHNYGKENVADTKFKTKSGYVGTIENSVLILTRDSQGRLAGENIKVYDG